jgi:hypothetical protein
MATSAAHKTAMLQHFFQNADMANMGDATGLRGSTTAGSFYIGLHTASPGSAGTQSTNEAAYTGYGRVAVVRSAAGFTVAGANVSNAANVLFPNCTASPGAALTHFSIGSALTGAGNLFHYGALGASYQPAIGNAPNFAIGALDVDTTDA